MYLILNPCLARVTLPEFQLPGLQKVVTELEVIPLASCALIALILIACSFRWLGKSAQLRRVREADADFTERFRSSAHAFALFQEAAHVDHSPRCVLYMNACRELAYHLLGTDSVDKNFIIKLRAAGRISPTQWLAVHRAAQRSLEESSRWLRRGLHGAGVRSLLGLGALGTALALLDRVGLGTLDIAGAASASRPFILALFSFVLGTAWQRRIIRRVEDEVADLQDFMFELETLIDRSFVDHRQPMETLPSLVGMGMADGPSFSLPPSEPTRSVATAAVGVRG